jgi:hypothetical protein
VMPPNIGLEPSRPPSGAILSLRRAARAERQRRCDN